MISLNPGTEFDVIIITAEYYEDHPFSPTAIIAKVLSAKGYSVGIIEKPKIKEDFLKLGSPKLFFCIASGSFDSMLCNYTPMKRKREDEEIQGIPERAVIFYCNKLKEYFKPCKIIIGGIESSLRRFAHYDYWDNKVRKSILLDSRADLLIYGNGEKQIIQSAERLSSGQDLHDIPGTCILSKVLPKNFTLLPSFSEVSQSPESFCRMQSFFSNDRDLAQEYDNNYVLQHRYPIYTSQDLDWIYSLDYSRRLRFDSPLKMAQFSVLTHRGCFGRCNFCSISLHQGPYIISRSEESILKEIALLAKHPEFKGYIDDLGASSSNMYGMDCDKRCGKDCFTCSSLDRSHKRIIHLLRKARQVPGVKKIFIRSGIRYDLALDSPEYVKEISEHHLSGCLKIAPEHFSPKVLKLMNKDNSHFAQFVSLFNKINHPLKQYLKYYLMFAHPGDSLEETKSILSKISKLQNIEQFQVFTPTPMTNSTCMYWSNLNPLDGTPVEVVHDFRTKKEIKRAVLYCLEKIDHDSEEFSYERRKDSSSPSFSSSHFPRSRSYPGSEKRETPPFSRFGKERRSSFGRDSGKRRKSG
jgi:uncharacterized radical SAM protein YgiQ